MQGNNNSELNTYEIKAYLEMNHPQFGEMSKFSQDVMLSQFVDFMNRYRNQGIDVTIDQAAVILLGGNNG